MPSPFPGMDPYLEEPGLWPDVHARLIAVVGELLTPTLRPRYVARVEQYTLLFDPSDPASELYIVRDVRVMERPVRATTSAPAGNGAVAVAEPIDVTGLLPNMARQRFLEIRDVANQQVVTVIEIVSPWNKRGGAAGRRRFQRKREEIGESDTNWLEIDLLRDGTRTIGIPDVPRSHYFAYADRTTADPEARRQLAWPIPLRHRLPVLPVPLRPADADVPLDLQAALDAVYDRAGYDLDIDYAADPTPPLEPEDAAWADGLLRAKGLRGA